MVEEEEVKRTILSVVFDGEDCLLPKCPPLQPIEKLYTSMSTLLSIGSRDRVLSDDKKSIKN